MMETAPIKSAMEVFKRHNPPAPDMDHSVDSMTTNQILEKFQNLLGEESIEKSVLCELLTQNGYVLDYVLDEFCWLIGEKS